MVMVAVVEAVIAALALQCAAWVPICQSVSYAPSLCDHDFYFAELF